MPGSPSKQGLQQAFELARLVACSRRRTLTQVARALGEHGESVLDWQVISNLHRVGPMHQVDLADHIGHHPASLSRLIDDLAARGLVKRSSDSADRRRRSVLLTEKGEAWYRRWEAIVFQVVFGVMGRLSPKEQRVLGELMQKLTTDAG